MSLARPQGEARGLGHENRLARRGEARKVEEQAAALPTFPADDVREGRDVGCDVIVSPREWRSRRGERRPLGS